MFGTPCVVSSQQAWTSIASALHSRSSGRRLHAAWLRKAYCWNLKSSRLRLWLLLVKRKGHQSIKGYSWRCMPSAAYGNIALSVVLIASRVDSVFVYCVYVMNVVEHEFCHTDYDVLF